MGLLVIACLLFLLGSVAFVVGMWLRYRAAQEQSAGLAIRREEALARKNAAWRLDIEGSYSEAVQFTAERKWWDSQHPNGMVEGYSINLGEIEREDSESLEKFASRIDEQRRSAEQIVANLEATRMTQPN